MNNDIEVFDEQEMKSLIEELLTATQRYRQELLAQKIMCIKDERTANLVGVLLYSEDAFIRNIAIEMLVSMGEKALPTLEEKLADQDRNIRKSVLDILKHIKGRTSCEIALKALDDEDENVVVAALEVMEVQQYKQVQDKLIEILKNTNSVWIINALLKTFESLNERKYLIAIGEKISFLNLTYIEKNILMNTYVRTIGSLGSLSDIDVIIKYSKDFIVEGSNIIFAISNLIVKNDTSNLPKETIRKTEVIFKEHWDYKDYNITHDLLPALVKLQMDFFLYDVEAMVDFYKGQEFFIENLYELLVKLKKYPYKFVNEILDSKEPELIKMALKLIHLKLLIGHNRIVEELCDSKDLDIAIGAFRIIVDIDSYKNMSLLERLTKGNDEKFTLLVTETNNNVCIEDFEVSSMNEDAFYTHVIMLINDPSDLVRRKTIKALINRNCNRSLEFMKKMYQDETDIINKREIVSCLYKFKSELVMDTLSDAISSNDVLTRLAVIKTLRFINSSLAVKMLQSMLNDSIEEVVEAAKEALYKNGVRK